MKLLSQGYWLCLVQSEFSTNILLDSHYGLTILLNHKTQYMMIDINLTLQELQLFKHGQLIANYQISSGLAGNGESEGSGKTPRGWHSIYQKIGQSMPENTVFRGRKATGEIYSQELHEACEDRDWILSRILWLQGMQPGINRFSDCDSKNRYIYIHGTPDHEPMGIPASHGCVRMRNHDVIHLFDEVSEGAQVFIHE